MQKKDVQPFITRTTKSVIYRLSFLTGYSVKQICEDFCNRSLRRREKLGEDLSPYFKREIKIGDKVFSPIERPLKQFPVIESVERVTVGISAQSYDFAYGLKHALGWSVAKVIAYCIERSMHDYDFLDFYITKYLESKIDSNRRDMLLTMMADINKDIPEEDHSITALLLGVVDEVKQAEISVSDVLGNVVGPW